LKHVSLYKFSHAHILRRNKLRICSIKEFQDVQEALERGLNFFNKTLPDLETYEALYAARAIQGKPSLG